MVINLTISVVLWCGFIFAAAIGQWLPAGLLGLAAVAWAEWVRRDDETTG